MTSQQFLVCDISTLANFKATGLAISTFIAAAGWVQHTDTGQVNWATLGAVPGNASFVYEIWKPGDGLANFYLKVEYGNRSVFSMRISVGTATNGAGTLTTMLSQACDTNSNNLTSPGVSNTYECDMSGDSGRLSFLLWRNAPNSVPQIWAVQRSLNSSGTPTGTYVTIFTAGASASGGGGNAANQQSLHLTVGAGQLLRGRSFGSNNFCGWACLGGNFTDNTTSAFNGLIPFSNATPLVGNWDYPCTVVGTAWSGDITEGVPFTITNQYGQTKTYMPTKNGALTGVSAAMSSTAACVEYD